MDVYKQDAHQMVAKRCTTKIRPKSRRRRHFRPEVAGDVISGVAVELVGLDVCATFGESDLGYVRLTVCLTTPYSHR